MIETFCFLTYMARSGSTFVGRELDLYEEIGVTIEDEIPDGILKGNPVDIKDSIQLSQYIEKLYNDQKFLNWKIDKDELENTILKTTFPIKLDDLYRSIYKLYFDDSQPAVVVHKKSQYYLKIEQVRKELPGTKFIHVIRDPRGTYNSQKKTTDSQTGKVMSQNVVAFALNYKKMTQIVNKFLNSDFFHVVKYENFVEDKEKELKKIVQFLEPQSEKKSEKSQYSRKIPESQKYLHANIDSEPIRQRIHGWQEELENVEAYVLEKCLRDELKLSNYPVKGKYQLRFTEQVKAMWLVMKFRLKHALSEHFPDFYNTLKKLKK